VFLLNVELFPESGNAYDSLAEAYMNRGDDDIAIESYKKSLELNSNNNNAVQQLQKFEADAD
jgi:Tfp pilus assembly protein PilF